MFASSHLFQLITAMNTEQDVLPEMEQNFKHWMLREDM